MSDGTFAYAPYELIPVSGAPRRRGALIRCSDDGGSFGYGDVHPWQELGDPPLEVLLRSLHTSEPIGPAAGAAQHAAQDIAFRRSGVSAFANAKEVANHASLPGGLSMPHSAIVAELERLASAGFSAVKVKAGFARETEIPALLVVAAESRRLHLRVRIDLNARLDFSSAEKFFEEIGAEPDWIDWVEDPSPYDDLTWSRWKRRFGVRLALDLANDREPAYGSIDVLVVKPAFGRAVPLLEYAEQHGLAACVTSYLGHPLDQLQSMLTAYEATRRNLPLELCGLLSHTAYEPNPFSELLDVGGPYLRGPDEPGFGWGQQLEALDWRPLPK
jgi:O-succinylbenzoate synthase